MNKLQALNLTDIVPNPNQPRKQFDEKNLLELSASIIADGLKSPILVRPINEDSYEIVQGERRFRASQLAGLDTIDAFVEEMDEQAAFHLAVIENIQREQLTAIEEAYAFQKYVEMGFKHEEIAKKVSKSRTYVTSRLRLLKLIPEIQDWIAEGRISEGHAKQLLKLRNELPGSEDNDKPFQAAQEKFIFDFQGKQKISVNDVNEWGGVLNRKLIIAIIGVFTGKSENTAIMLEACNNLGIDIEDLKRGHIELLVQNAIDILPKEKKRSYVYQYYEEVEEYIFNFEGDITEEWSRRALEIHTEAIKEGFKKIEKAKVSMVDALKRAADMDTGQNKKSLLENREKIGKMDLFEFMEFVSCDTN